MLEETEQDELIERIVRRYNNPAAEWKDFDIQLAVLDIGQLIGVITNLRQQLREKNREVL